MKFRERVAAGLLSLGLSGDTGSLDRPTQHTPETPRQVDSSERARTDVSRVKEVEVSGVQKQQSERKEGGSVVEEENGEKRFIGKLSHFFGEGVEVVDITQQLRGRYTSKEYVYGEYEPELMGGKYVVFRDSVEGGGPMYIAFGHDRGEGTDRPLLAIDTPISFFTDINGVQVLASPEDVKYIEEVAVSGVLEEEQAARYIEDYLTLHRVLVRASDIMTRVIATQYMISKTEDKTLLLDLIGASRAEIEGLKKHTWKYIPKESVNIVLEKTLADLEKSRQSVSEW